ncbi:hypothetical protein F0U44_04030 [Nocardioides humilatus]|uniref:Lipopolysaccharide biosynthesis protein n=1 Tax=Nocardioides humilatus TaxID=2607660 RepID=A0A5B1LLX5_9ACTN|nr:hypothetical protein [Nocardioides humilatus]KAA1421466.1 hypothetical protein F0U44_04030 [Nocardioides humilatus]
MTLDQIISSVSNFMVLIWSAHALEPIDFGRFSLAFLIYMFIQGGIVRSLVSWTVMAHPEDADSRARGVLGSAVLLAFVAGLFCIACGGALLLVGSEMGTPIVLVGALMPLLSIQDVGRYLGIAQAKPGRAVFLDTLWLVLTVAALGAIALTDNNSLLWLVLGWGGTGALAGLWVFVQQGVPRAHDLSLRWLRSRWEFSWRSLVAASSSAAVAMFGSLAVAVVSGPLAVAAVRAALILERPSTTVQGSVAVSVGADIARQRPDNAGLIRMQRRALVIGIAVAIVMVLIFFLIPDSFGRILLGDVWALVTPLLLVISLRVLANGTQSGVRAALMGRRQIKPVMKIDILGTVLMIAGMVIGAAIGDGEGAMWGAFVGQLITIFFWWGALIVHLRSDFTYPDDLDPAEVAILEGRTGEATV